MDTATAKAMQARWRRRRRWYVALTSSFFATLAVGFVWYAATLAPSALPTFLLAMVPVVGVPTLMFVSSLAQVHRGFAVPVRGSQVLRARIADDGLEITDGDLALRLLDRDIDLATYRHSSDLDPSIMGVLVIATKSGPEVLISEQTEGFVDALSWLGDRVPVVKVEHPFTLGL